ncbi:MarR family winged helix-turn-helix transcriptional regulator [Paenibacillus riograndensis]|uniref:Transcriptional regulator n=1 Tax=Paenibacillus riograndensis SBR5 TaxID=1073571 RepID=A0A0E4H6S0_9BACL|nr:MarR family transcriptional regulator [Paenibacillus riograndensis]CQR52378.1 transcriptional regulator [Paenibacillus riograndensis SBR5]
MDYDKELYLLHLMKQVYSSLISVSNKLQATGDKYSAPLTSRQYMTLLAILHLPEDETTIINIANKLGATKQNIAQLINSLEKKNFISVVSSKKDKRAVNVHVTTLGLETLESCGISVTIDFMADIFKDFKLEELETLSKFLLKLYQFDGSKMDGLEVDVQVPNTFSEEEIRTAIERFSIRRNGKL